MGAVINMKEQPKNRKVLLDIGLAGPFAGLLVAISPGMVFFSRYYIQETLLVFFTFAAIGCAWRWFRSGSPGWAAGAGASFGLMHATKETWILAAAAMMLSSREA